MPLFSAGSVFCESGVLYASTMQPLPRATTVKVDYNVPRANVSVLGRGKPLENRPVINYTPVAVQVEGYASDSQLTQILGLTSPAGICTNITDTKAASATYGIRSMQVLYAPMSSTNYNGQLDIKSGVLSSFSLQGSVGDPVHYAFTLDALDYSGSVNTTARASTNAASNLIKPENVSLTGIQLTGYGLTGITITQFGLNVGFTRSTVHNLGTKFPTERPLTDVGATLQCQGYFDGVNNSMTGLSAYDCGAPTSGVVGLTLSPSCGGGSPMTITMKNPYFEGLSTDSQVGGFTTFSLNLSLPIGPNPNETTDGSVLIFN